MHRTFRTTAVMAAALASLAPFGVARAQEANAWDIAPIVGRVDASADAPLSRAALTREQVRADLEQARREGTFHASGEGPTPDRVLEMRVAANQREGERIARAYRDEADRVARAATSRPQPAAPEAATTTPVSPSEPVQAGAAAESSNVATPTSVEPQSTAPSAAAPTPGAQSTPASKAPSPDGDRAPALPTQQPDAAVDSRGTGSPQPMPNDGAMPNTPSEPQNGNEAAPARMPSNDAAPAESSPVRPSSGPLDEQVPLSSEAQPLSGGNATPASDGTTPSMAPSEAPAAPAPVQSSPQSIPAPVESPAR